VANYHWSSGKYLRVSKHSFSGFQSDLSLSARAVRSCPVVGRRRAFRQCPGVDRLRVVRPCPAVESCRVVRPCQVVRGRRAVRSLPGVDSSIFMPPTSHCVSSGLDLRSSLISKIKESPPVKACRAVRSCPFVGSCSVEPPDNRSVRFNHDLISTSAHVDCLRLSRPVLIAFLLLCVGPSPLLAIGSGSRDLGLELKSETEWPQI